MPSDGLLIALAPKGGKKGNDPAAMLEAAGRRLGKALKSGDGAAIAEEFKVMHQLCAEMYGAESDDMPEEDMSEEDVSEAE